MAFAGGGIGGPPLFPGLIAASVWITFWIGRPELLEAISRFRPAQRGGGEGYKVDLRGYTVDLRGYKVDLRGYKVDHRGHVVGGRVECKESDPRR
eukprot:469201-Prorocentrum_minimum.AAC.3